MVYALAMQQGHHLCSNLLIFAENVVIKLLKIEDNQHYWGR